MSAQVTVSREEDLANRIAETRTGISGLETSARENEAKASELRAQVEGLIESSLGQPAATIAGQVQRLEREAAEHEAAAQLERRRAAALRSKTDLEGMIAEHDRLVRLRERREWETARRAEIRRVQSELEQRIVQLAENSVLVTALEAEVHGLFTNLEAASQSDQFRGLLDFRVGDFRRRMLDVPEVVRRRLNDAARLGKPIALPALDADES